MRDSNLEEIVGRAAELSASTERLVAVLNGLEDDSKQPFDTSKPIAERDSSIAQIAGRIHTAVGMVAEFDKASRIDLVPLKTLTNLNASIVKAKGVVDTLIKALDELSKKHGGLQTFDYSSFDAIAKDSTGHNLKQNFHAIFDQTEVFLVRFFESLFILSPRAAFDFQSAASSLSSVINDANQKLGELSASISSVAETLGRLAATERDAANHLDNAKIAAEETERLNTSAAADRQTVSDYLAEVTQNKVTVEAIRLEASSLKDSVNAYQSTFEQFQKQLDARQGAFETGNTKLDSLIASFEGQRDGVETLIGRSKQMLSSATVSGLAANFAKMTSKLTWELRWARVAFYVGILLLAISALPLFAFVLLPIFAPFLEVYSPEFLADAMRYGPGSAETGFQYLGRVLARIAMLLPAAWLVSFAARRHAPLFRLREHYAYKYSMAVAVQGFKLEAPDYEQEIAAVVLEQLAFNPADKLGSGPIKFLQVD